MPPPLGLAHLSADELVGEAGGDPWKLDDELQSGQPGAINDLADAFHRASGCVTEVEDDFASAKKMFEQGWRHNDTGHPINESAEVTQTTTRLDLQRPQMATIAVDLETVAAALASAQRNSDSAIGALDAALHSIDDQIGAANAAGQDTRALHDAAVSTVKTALGTVQGIRDGYATTMNSAERAMLATTGYAPDAIEAFDGQPRDTAASSEELKALQEATNQAVIDQLAKVKTAKKALDDAMATAYTHGPGDPTGQAAIADLPKLKAEYGRALDDLGNIPDYSKVDPRAMSATGDGRFLLGYTADGQPVQVTGQLKNGNGEIFDQAKQTYFTFQDGKLVGTRQLDAGKVTPDDELLFNTVTAAVGAPEMAAGAKVGGEAAWHGLKALLGREGLDGAGFGAGSLTADNVLPKAFTAAEARADTAAHNLAIEHGAGPPVGVPSDHSLPSTAGTGDHPAPVDTRAHPPPAGPGDAFDHHVPIGPMPPQAIGDIRGWLPDINHGPGMDIYDPARGVNCGDCAAAVENRLSGEAPDATAGLGTLSVPQMEAATGLQQVPATPAQIEQYLINQGAGAHTVVGVDRANGVAGHWFNAYYDGNRVYAVDGQTDDILGWPPNMDVPGSPVTNWDMGIPK